MKRLPIPARWLPYAVRTGLGFGVALLFILHSIHVLNLPLVANLEGLFYDARVRATMPDSISQQVVIIDIDEKSLKQEGRWPWSRERLGELVSKLVDHYKVAVVGMDVVFAEPENQSSIKMMERLSQREAGQISGKLSGQDKEIRTLLARLQPLLDGDQAFARVLKGRNVVMGYYFKRGNNLEADNLSGKLPAPACDLTQAAAQGVKPQPATGYGANLPLLQDAAAGGGHFLPNLDADGIIRTLPLLMEYQGKCYESLSLAILRRIVDAPQLTVERGADRWSSHSLKVGELSIPVMEDASAWIPYRGVQGSFHYISAVDVLEQRADPKQLEGVVALLGTTAAGLLDARATPVGNPYAGVEVHANMVAGMLEGSIKKSPTAIPGMESWILALVGLTVAVLLARASPMQAMWLALGTSVLVTVANLALWLGASVVLPLASPLLLIGVLFVLNMSYGFVAEERTKRLYKERFGQYVSPEVIEEMIANPQLQESMEGSSRSMTVLFSDIRNFTGISEGMQPKDLMRMMNEYLTPMTRLIIDKNKYQGTIDKYIGDAIMAFWGAPLFDANHAKNGVLAALEMQQLAAELSAQFKAKNWPEIRIGVGLNTGMMAVGNMGSSFRRAYTVLGDPVNLAARLEGLTKEYGVGILVSETTKDAAPDIVYREVDRVRVKGKGLAVSIYEPVAIEGEASSELLNRIEQFHQALRHYRAQQWDQAEAILRSMPQTDEVLVRLYLQRIAELRAHPPGKDWDGVTSFTTK
jgi:adenylate cyclase